MNHGFRSATVLLPGDDASDYEALLTELEEHFEPRDVTETRLIREMADAEWRLRRVRRHMESAFSRHMAALAPLYPALDPLDLQSLAVETLNRTGCSHATWLRYETKFERQHDRAYAAWSRYQADQRSESRREAGLPAAELASNVQNALHRQEPPPAERPSVPRSAPCPCGSGDKYKRCCGTNAPPVLQNRSQPALPADTPPPTLSIGKNTIDFGYAFV